MSDFITPSMTVTLSPTSSITPRIVFQITASYNGPSQVTIVLSIVIPVLVVYTLVYSMLYLKEKKKKREKVNYLQTVTVVSPIIVQENPLQNIPRIQV